MYASSLLLAASSILPLASAAPLLRRGGQQYQVFGGDGTMAQGWPSKSQWQSYEQLWSLSLPTLQHSCTQYQGSPQDNTETEIKQIDAAIKQVAGETGIDARYLLVIMMQESKGCVRAPTTNYGQNNPGLFQSFNGLATCNPDNVNFETPCPQSEILAMVREGAGIGRPFGLKQALEQAGAGDDSKYYKAARIYNSGSIAQSGNLGDGIATHCYATDIANRLVGWPNAGNFPTKCEETSIGGIQGSGSAYAGPINSGNGDNTPAPPKVNNPPKTENPPQTPPKVVTPPKAKVPPKNDTPKPTNPPSNQPSGPKIEGAAANCKSWYTVKDGDDCSKLSVPFETLRKLNSQLDSNCSNLWLGYAYCVAA